MKNIFKDIKNLFSRDNLFTGHDPIQHGFESQIKVIGDDEKVVDLDKYRMAPKRISKSLILSDIESFKKYIDRFSSTGKKTKENQHHGDATAFVRVHPGRSSPLSVECFLDYHSAPGLPANCDHEVELDCSLDKSFSAWLQSDNEWMSQTKLVQFFKKNNSFFADSQELLKMLGAIEDVKSSTSRRDRSQAGAVGSEINLKFELLGEFNFRFKPLPSINKNYSIKVDVFADYGSNGLQLKYAIRNPDAIWTAVAADIRTMLEKLGDKVVVF